MTISLKPFIVNGRTFRVIGTQAKPHLHKVKAEDTGETWWMPHEKVKRMQTKQP